MMSAAAVLAGVNLCKISRWVEHNPVVADTHETASGRKRRDYLTQRRSWSITLVNLTRTERETLLITVASNPKPVPFWIDEFAGTPETDSIMVHASISNSARVARWQANGAWGTGGGGITITLQEADQVGAS